MIEASQFVGLARRSGFDFWAGVPCSFLTPFINYIIGDDDLTYLSSSNEGDAVAAATGAALGGRRSVAMMQNSGLGNAVSPLTSLNHVFRIPILLIITLRGEPGRPDEPQHELMGQITPELLETMQIPWSWFPENEDDVENALEKALRHMDRTGRPYALVMRKGAVAACPLRETKGFQPNPGRKQELPASYGLERPSRADVLEALVTETDPGETVLIGSTGYNGRELYAVDDRPNQLYMVGSMGCASSLGLGLSLTVPGKKVVVIDGDGAVLMRMGNLPSVGAYARNNFYHLLLDNGVHESTGGQQTVSPAIDYAAIALASGYNEVIRGRYPGDVNSLLSAEAPAFMCLETARGVAADLPRPSVKPAQVARRLMAHMGVEVSWREFETS